MTWLVLRSIPGSVAPFDAAIAPHVELRPDGALFLGSGPDLDVPDEVAFIGNVKVGQHVVLYALDGSRDLNQLKRLLQDLSSLLAYHGQASVTYSESSGR